MWARDVIKGFNAPPSQADKPDDGCKWSDCRGICSTDYAKFCQGVTFAPNQASAYLLHTSGTCNSASSAVTTKDECQVAAKWLNMQDNKATEITDSGFPKGCFWDLGERFKKNRLKFNTHQDPSPSSSSSTRRSICSFKRNLETYVYDNSLLNIVVSAN